MATDRIRGNEALRGLLAERLPATLELLRQWVDTNSHTSNREGVNCLGRLTAEPFGRLGFVPEFVPHRDPAFGDHLVLTRRGNRPRGIALISHLDTVFPAEEEVRNAFRWQPEGERIYGPGTIDIKGGTAMMYAVLEALANTSAELFESVTWIVLLDATEETLSDHFADVCRERLDPERTLAALVFESEGRPQGRPAVVVARKGRATFRVTVEGRAAHAGARHARGANAITQLARLVERIDRFTNHAADLTFNVGRIQGGSALNRVPHLAAAELEMRAFSPKMYCDGVEAVLALAGPGDVSSPSDGHRCQVRVELLTESPPWPRNPGTDALYERWRTAGAGLGLELDAEERGGLSDGNWISRWLPTLDGLGPFGDNDHCSERSADGSKTPEFLWVPSFLPKALLNAVVLRDWLAER